VLAVDFLKEIIFPFSFAFHLFLDLDSFPSSLPFF
jgi:hypothetical protein